MKKEIPYFTIGDSYGGNQDWFPGTMMKRGGCAAATACDCCICLAKNQGAAGLCPIDICDITKDDYIRFAGIMEPYIHPRPGGVDKLEIFTEGFGRYASDVGIGLTFGTVSGDAPAEQAKSALKDSIDRNVPAACLILHHDNPAMDFYVWHWFILAGYEEAEEAFMVKAVTYSEYRWLDFDVLWDTGHEKKGGLVMPRLRENIS
ncbi:MAG: hypothetical protein ACI3VB_03405 [Oscillospiraceae bacterium]